MALGEGFERGSAEDAEGFSRAGGGVDETAFAVEVCLPRADLMSECGPPARREGVEQRLHRRCHLALGQQSLGLRRLGLV